MNSLSAFANKKIPFKGISLQLMLLGTMSLSGVVKYVFCFAVVAIGCILGIKTIRLRFGRWSHKQSFRLVAPFLAIVTIGLVMDLAQNESQLVEGLKQTIMYLEPAVLAAIVLHYSNDDDELIGVQLVSTILIFFATTLPHFNAIDLLESTAAFSFGLFSLFYLTMKKPGAFLVSLICLALANKRIALAAIAVASAVYLYLKKSKHKKTWAVLFFSAFFVLVVLYFNAIYSGDLRNLFDKFGINSMGRLDLYPFFSDEYSLILSLDKVGFGLGYVINKLNLIHYSNAAGNLHNDWLSLFIEAGIPSLVVLFVSTILIIRSLPFGKVAETTDESCALLVAVLLYWQILWLTDNVTIYVFVLYPYYTILFSLLRRIERTQVASE